MGRRRHLRAIAPGLMRILIVNEALRGGPIWTEIERWMDEALVERGSAR